jgi:hypothetical protein
MILNVIYDERGEIVSFETGDATTQGPGLVRVRYDGDVARLRARHYRIVDGELVEKSDGEIADLMRPTLSEINTAILCELNATDDFVDPPSDRPLKGPFLLDWKPYRKALRDLSKLDGPDEMVRAWPLRPDGSDAIAPLRARLR